MGLLDALFSNDGYGGQGGGLLDLLRNSQMQNSQYQPAPGFAGDQPSPPASFADRFNAMPNAPQQFQPSGRQFDAASFNPSTYAPNQAQPVAVGNNYQMPRVGSADQFASAQPAQQAQPAQAGLSAGATQPRVTDMSAQSRQPQPDAQSPPDGSFGGNFGAALQNFGNAGSPLQALVGAITGATTGQRTDALGIQQQSQAQMFKAFVDAGMPRNVAMAAALNPKVLEQVGPGYFAKNEIVEGGTDPLTGKKSWVLKDTVDGKVTELNGSGTGAASGGLQETISNLSNMPSGATPEQRLAQVPEAYRGYVKSLLAGQALPSNVGRSTLRGPIMTLAHAVDPTFDEANIPLRFKTTADYAPNGQSGRSIVALNTVQHHIGKLSDDLENVGDTGWTVLNSIRNGLAVNTPMNPTQGKAIQAVKDDIKAVTDEMSAAYKAGRVSDHEIEAWNKLANSDLPLRQLKQGIYDFVGLLNGKRDQLNETHQAIVGREAPGINKDLNSVITQKVTQRNSDGSQSSASGGVQEGATATNPQTGAKLTYKNGKWQ